MTQSNPIPDDLKKLTDLKEIGKYVHDQRSAINSVSPHADYGAIMLEQNTCLIDNVLRHLFDLSCARIPEFLIRYPELAIVATGGYGRRELAPYSDIDLTFMPAEEDDVLVNVVIKDMFQAVVDVFMYGANMKIGYAYRLFGDLAQLDHQTQTALLDARLVTGDKGVFDRFCQEHRRRILLLDFLHGKSFERESTIRRSGLNVYTVEPDIKNGVGGLRDAQALEWFTEVIFNCPRNSVLGVLEENSVLTENDARQFREAFAYLLRIRNTLHCITQEARDILTTEKQERVAKVLAYPDSLEKPAVEAFMAEYYKHTSLISRIASKVTRRSLASHIDLEVGGLASEERSIMISDYKAAEQDEAMPFHAVELAQAYQLSYDDRFEEDLEAYIKAKSQNPNIDLCSRVFTRMLQAPHGVAKAIRDLVNHKSLFWLIPEFEPLVTLIPYDAAHDYTVGEHSLHVVECMERLRYTDDPKLTEYNRVWCDVANPEVLYLAGLLHDLGKQWPGGPGHEETGAEAMKTIGKRLGWDNERVEKLVFLVRRHLVMAQTSRLRDLDLDETIREFTHIVADQDQLNMLYILTCADTHSVGNGIWTEMRGKFLSELYARSTAALSAMNETGASEEQVFNNVPNIDKHKERLKKQLSHHNLPQEAIHEHIARMPAQYLLNTPLEEMYQHMAMINRLRSTGMPTVDFRTEYGSDFTELTIVAFDDPSPGLLAKIVGCLFAIDLNIHGSQVFTRESSISIAIDRLWIDYRGKPLSSSKRAEVQDTLRNVLMGVISLPDLLKKRRKPPVQQVIHKAVVNNTASDRYSMIEMRAPDETGVLYRLTGAISSLGWNIHSARVSVWGSRVIATFYVTDTGGQKIDAQESEKLALILPKEEFRRRK